MVIDIVDMTEDKYKNLSAVQLSMIRAAQGKKNAALEKAEKKKAEVFHLLLSNNAARSSALANAQREITEETEREIEIIKEELDYQLAYETIFSVGNEDGLYRYPENPNYNLSSSQRFLVVREYYMNVTSDPNARLKAYSMDSLARSYLGEFYDTLYELLASYCN